MRIMGLDFGSRTVGVAISDSLLLTAQGVEIIRRKEENKLRQTLARIEELMMEAGIRRENRKDYVDMIAATLILQGYLDRRNNEKKKETE